MDLYIAPGRLEELGQLGAGAFGVVLHGRFKNAKGEELEVAIKQLSPTPRGSPQASASSSSRGEAQQEEFMREISSTISVSLKCPNVVRCYGWSAMKNGSLCLVMRRYKTSLHTVIFMQMDEPMPLRQVVKLGLSIARGLLQLHRLRILYQDLKPANVLLDDDEDSAVLADFGLSKPMGAESQHSTHTLAGTYFYMPPEKMHPDKKKVGYYSDMWSFGVTLLQMLTSNLNAPYGAGVALPNLIFSLLVNNEPPEVAPIPECPALHALLVACLSLNGAARPSAADAVKTLEAILHTLTTPSSVPQSAVVPQSAASQEFTGVGKSCARGCVAFFFTGVYRSREELRKKLAAVELCKEEEQKRRAEAERKLQEAEQREAQMQERSRTADAQRCAQTAGAQPKRALELLSNPAHTTTLSGHTDIVLSVAFTPNGTSLVSGSDDKTVKVWDLASGRCTATLEGHSDWVHSVAVSVDGRTVASGSNDYTVKLWDLDSRRCRATFTGHLGLVQSVTFSPDGATYASGSGDHTISCAFTYPLWLWNASIGMHKATLKGSDTYGVAFSPDSMRLASGEFWGYRVWLWDVRSGKNIAKLEGHDPITSVVFSLDGTHVLSGSYDKTIRVWDTNTKACKRTMTGHSDWVKSVALTRDGDGEYAVSGSLDKIKIWDWQCGVCVATLQCYSWVYSVAFCRFQRAIRLAGGQDDGKINCHMYSRTPTTAESCRNEFMNPTYAYVLEQREKRERENKP